MLAEPLAPRRPLPLHDILVSALNGGLLCVEPALNGGLLRIEPTRTLTPVSLPLLTLVTPHLAGHDAAAQRLNALRDGSPTLKRDLRCTVPHQARVDPLCPLASH